MFWGQWRALHNTDIQPWILNIQILVQVAAQKIIVRCGTSRSRAGYDSTLEYASEFPFQHENYGELVDILQFQAWLGVTTKKVVMAE